MLIVEEGNPAYIEQAVNVELRHAEIQTKVLGKGPLPQAGGVSPPKCCWKASPLFCKPRVRTGSMPTRSRKRRAD